MSSSREPDRLRDILENIVAVESYIEGLTVEAFMRDRKTVDVCERCLQRITKAAIKIGEARMGEIAPHLPFHALRGLGNSLRHEYDRIDDQTVYDTINDELPRLSEACRAALEAGSSN
jgi:uncharacterized protein with HEPN domain